MLDLLGYSGIMISKHGFCRIKLGIQQKKVVEEKGR
jgi:hypothetical protein